MRTSISSRAVLIAASMLLSVLAACGAQRANAPSTDAINSATPKSDNDSTNAPSDEAAPDSSTGIALVEIGTLDQPVDAAHRENDDAIYFVSRVGTIHRFLAGRFESTPVLDISDLTRGEGERGLLGLAFSIDGSRAFINYTNLGGDTVIASLRVDPNGVFDRGSLRNITTIAQPYRNHNAGDLVVEPSGTLLVPMGDGGSANDPLRVSLDDASPLGKVLRIDPITGATTIIARGLRNPWRVDLHEDRLWMADVGQNKWEEVSVLDAVSTHTGGVVIDFGWSAYEADMRFNDDQSSPQHVPPVVKYEHGADGCSISGGAVAVRGGLSGRYVFADYCSGRVWSIATDGESPLMTRHFDSLDTPVAVVRAHDDLYVLSLSGTIWRIDG